ncbi:MAG: hypothetical protein N2449_08285 [Bacteroidales bacterium]|nr:hypothetical protein [Bacteroidales bacterium]
MINNRIYFILFFYLILFSCKKENHNVTQIKNLQGIFIVNEGNFTWGNSSLSFIDENNLSVTNDIFFKANQVTLGDVAMDMKIIHNFGFIVVNNSGIIYIVNPENSKHIATIGNLTSPRFILPINDTTAYVSDLYSPYISIIHTKKFIKTGQIWVGSSTEALVKFQHKVFVTSWSFKSKVYVIDCEQSKVIDSILVGKQPQSIVSDKNGHIWVLCDGGYPGNPIGHDKPSLWIINGQTHDVVRTIIFPNKDASARSLSINQTGDTIAFIFKHIYRMAISDTLFPTSPFITASKQNFYTVWHHPSKPWVIATDAKNYVSNGDVYIYHTIGNVIAINEAGIIPSAICYFKK